MIVHLKVELDRKYFGSSVICAKPLGVFFDESVCPGHPRGATAMEALDALHIALVKETPSGEPITYEFHIQPPEEDA